MSGEAPYNCNHKKESSGMCPDKKVNVEEGECTESSRNGKNKVNCEIGECSRKVCCDKSASCKDCSGHKSCPDKKKVNCETGECSRSDKSGSCNDCGGHKSCPDKKKVNGETGECSRKVCCDKSASCKDCSGHKSCPDKKKVNCETGECSRSDKSGSCNDCGGHKSCPDKKKVNGETGECSRKVCCGRPKDKAKKGWEHVNEPLTKEQKERLDAMSYIIRTENHHFYVKTIGAKVSPSYNVQLLTTEGLTRSLNTIRIKDISSILGEKDEMLDYIFKRAGASIAIIADLRGMQYHVAIIEFSGTAAQIKDATTLVSQAIKTKYPVDSVPEAMLPENILHEKMPLPKHQAGHLIGMRSLLEIEAASSTWLKLEESEGMIDILISGTFENNLRAKTMINTIVSEAKNQKSAKPPKMFEFNLGDFRWKWMRGAAHKRIEWGCRRCAVKMQTGEDNKPTDNVDNSIEAKKVPAVAEVNNGVPNEVPAVAEVNNEARNEVLIDAGGEVGPSMSYIGGGDDNYNGRNAGYYTAAHSVGAYGEFYPSAGYWVGGCS